MIASIPSWHLIQLFQIFFDFTILSHLQPLRLTLQPHPSCSSPQLLLVSILINLLCRRPWQVCHHVLLLSLRLLALCALSPVHDVIVPSYFAFTFDPLTQKVFLPSMWHLWRPLCIYDHLLHPLLSFLPLLTASSSVFWA